MKDTDIYSIQGPIDLTFFTKFAGLSGCEQLCFEPITPVYPPADFFEHKMFLMRSRKDRMLHHPYEVLNVL